MGFVEQQKLHTNYHRTVYTHPTDPKFYKQWSLVSEVQFKKCTQSQYFPNTLQLNTGRTAGQAGKDLNVEPAWMQGITGKGVVVSVFDDGMCN